MFNNKGSALIAVITLAIIMNIVFMAVYFTVSSSQKAAGNKRVSTVVLAIAEAGKEHALSLFRSGAITPEASTTKTILSNITFSGGSYSVSYTTDALVNKIILNTTASYAMAQCAIEVTIAVAGCFAPSDSAYNYGIISGGSITWSGSGTCDAVTANIHTNNQFSTSGSSNFNCQLLSASAKILMSGSGDIIGNVKTPILSKSGSCKITGTTSLAAVANVTISAIDLTPYYNHALTNGQVFSGTKKINGSSNVTIPGGILWVNGDFEYSGSGTISGSIFATGNIKISGSGDFIAASTYPAIVSRDGDLDMSGSGKVSGLIYTRVGQITKSGSGDVIGSIISGGEFKKSGSWNTLTYKNSAPIPPNCTGTQYTEVSWREL